MNTFNGNNVAKSRFYIQYHQNSVGQYMLEERIGELAMKHVLLLNSLSTLGTVAAAIIAAIAVWKASTANKVSSKALNAQLTPYLALSGIQVIAAKESMQFGVIVEIRNYGNGPALNMVCETENSLGHKGSIKGQSLMPGQDEKLTIAYTNKPRGEEELAQWQEQMLAPKAWYSFRIKYQTSFGETHVLSDTSTVSGPGHGNWQGMRIEKMSAQE